MITIMVFRGPARRGIAAVRAASDGRGQKLLMFIDPSLGGQRHHVRTIYIGRRLWGAGTGVPRVGLCGSPPGFYMSITGIVPASSLVAGEQILVTRHPTMKPAFARMTLSIPFIVVAAYLFELTDVPYVFPFVFFLVGLYLFFKGAMRYLRNLHVTYTVTDRRVVHLYRFLWLHTKEMPAARIISISEARNFFEIVTGRGSVVVSRGIGERQTIRMDDISDLGPIAELIRGFFS